MALARETVRLGLGARGQAKIKVRQPLGEAVVVADGREREAIERLTDVVREELNVRAVRFVAAADELGSYEVKANYRTLGPLFGSDMPLAAAAIAALDPSHVAAAMRDGGEIGIAVDGREHTLSADDLLLTMRAPDGYSVEREGAHAVALDLAIDEDLRREGRAREIVHAVQNARKSAGLQVEDRIELALDGDPALIDAARAHRDYLAGETLALELHIGEAGDAGRARDGLLRADRDRRPAVDDVPQPGPAGRLSRSGCGQRRLQLRLELLLGVGADDRLDGLAGLEQDHRGDREHLEARGGLRVLVDVELDDSQLRALGGDLLEDRRDDAARTAPRRPEVDEHGPLGFEHLGVEVVVCDLRESACHRGSPWSLTPHYTK